MESCFLISLFFFFSFFCDKSMLNPQKRPKKAKKRTDMAYCYQQKFRPLRGTNMSDGLVGRRYLEIMVTSSENREYSASPSNLE